MKLQNRTKIRVNNAFEGRTIEEELAEFMAGGAVPDDLRKIHEPIYTERKDGVLPQYDIRTDRWELAQEAMDKVNEAREAKADDRSMRDHGQAMAKGQDNARTEISLEHEQTGDLN